MNREDLSIYLKTKGFPENIAQAFTNIKREFFVPQHLIPYAYEDMALPVSEGHTISQPSTIAFMLELLELKPKQNILEIGSGSGYVLALICEIIQKEGEIYGLEILEKPAIESKKRLTENKNIHIIYRDGVQGLPDKAPFDRILISAACPDLDSVYSLTPQLAVDGIIVAAVKDEIVKIIKHSDSLEKQNFPGFSFVPLKKS